MLKDRSLSIALVQSENEVLHTPAFDLSAFLASDPDKWDLQLFTDRNFEGLIETAGQFDCLILGFNVLHLTRELVETLEASLPDTGILVLHQLTDKALRFLPPDLGVKVGRLPDTEEHVVLPVQVEPDDEILFRWPERVETDLVEAERAASPGSTATATHQLEGYALCYLEEAVGNRWRRFLEVEHDGHRRAVGIRTPRTRHPGILLCNLWLEPSREDHAALLTNMVRYCARGVPDVAVLTPGGDARLDVLARKVSLQGIRVVQVPAPDPSEPSPFERWPLRRVERAVVDENRAVDDRWRQRGGVVVRVAESGDLSLSGGQSDQLWVATCWAAWFSAVPPQRWHGGRVEGEDEPSRGSIFQSRAILRMLDWIAQQPAEAVGSLALPVPATFAPYLGALVAPRVNPDGGVDGTISSTTAAWDINALTGDNALTDKTEARMEKWLRDSFRDATHMSVADRLDIARALRDYDLLEEALEWLRERCRSDDAFTPPGARVLPKGGMALSPMIVTRLRQTCVAVSASDAGGSSTQLAELLQGIEEDRDSGLSTNLLLAAEHLDAAVAFEDTFGEHDPTLLDPSSEQAVANIELAIGTLSRHGRVVHIGEDGERWDPASVNGESISTEALSLIAYFGRQPASDGERPITNTHFISPRSRGLPPIAVNQLISEVQESRKAFVHTDQELARVTTQSKKQERVLNRARHILGALALFLVVPVVWHFWPEEPDVPTVLGTFAYGAATLVIAWIILIRLELAPGWLESWAKPALEMTLAPLKPILSAMQRKKPDPPPNA